MCDLTSTIDKRSLEGGIRTDGLIIIAIATRERRGNNDMKRHDLFEFYSPATRRTGRAAAAGCEGSFKGSIGHNVWGVWVCVSVLGGVERGRKGTIRGSGECGGSDARGGLGVTVPEPLRPWVMRRVFAQRAWASYEFLSFHGNVTESPPSRMFVRAGAPNPLVPPFSSHTFMGGGFFSNIFSISIEAVQHNPTTTTESSPKQNKKPYRKADDDDTLCF